MDYIKLARLVKAEAKLLKLYAIKNQLKKLDFLKLDSDNVERCIYGQMTAHCCSQAASDLINKCCKNVYTNMHANLKYSILNGAPRERIDKLSIPFLSPI